MKQFKAFFVNGENTIKMLLAASVFLLFGTSLVLAEGEQKSGVTFDMFGSASAMYKMQNDFKTPFDIAGLPIEGAANRSKQNVTQNFKLRLLAMAEADGSVKYPEWMVLAELSGSPLSPDKEDGASAVDVGHAFVMWKPHMGVKIKMGKHAVIGTGYDGPGFAGPYEFDAIRTASAAMDGAGLTIGAYLGSINHEAGISMINEGPIVSVLYAAGEAANEPQEGGHKNNILWYKGKILDKSLQIRLAQQTVDIVRTHAEDNIHAHPFIDSGKHEQYGEYSTHTVTSLNMAYKIGSAKTDFGYWKADGKAPWNSPLEPGVTEKQVEATGMILGVEINDVGPGSLAFEYSTVSTPAYGEEGSASSVIDLKSISSLEYTFKIRENTRIKFTHRQLTAGDYWTNGEGSSDTVRAPTYDWTSTSMTGITLAYDFGNNSL